MRVASSTIAFSVLLIALANCANARVNEFEGFEEHYDVLIDAFDGEELPEDTQPNPERKLFFAALWRWFCGGRCSDSSEDVEADDSSSSAVGKTSGRSAGGGDKVSGDKVSGDKDGASNATSQDPRQHEGFGIVGSYVSFEGNCTQPTDVCEYDGTGDKGIYVCRQVPEILQIHGRSEMTKCIDPEFAHSTDRCGCCDGKCAQLCPCPCEPKANGVDGSQLKVGFEMILENDEHWKMCVPESQVDTMRALSNAKCDMSCPQAEKMKEEGEKSAPPGPPKEGGEKPPKNVGNKGNSTEGGEKSGPPGGPKEGGEASTTDGNSTSTSDDSGGGIIGWFGSILGGDSDGSDST